MTKKVSDSTQGHRKI